jgi:prophage antirepressor-like protein
MDIANPRAVAARLDDDEKGVATTDTLGGQQQIAIITEPGH